MGALGLRRVEVDGAVVDVRVVDGVVAEVASGIAFPRNEEVVDGGGGALLPGLHDHHVHLLAMAAARRSVRVGPPEVLDHQGLVAALRVADGVLPPDAWLRAVGYHESVAGHLDRVRLDEIVARRPLRVQHRSGALWLLNTAALRAVAEGGEGDGRLFGADGWLRDRLPPEEAPDLAAIGTELSGYGVTGVTDATPVDRMEDVEVLASACAQGHLPQDVQVTGGPALAGCEMPAALRRGPVKVLLADHRLPALDQVVAWVRDAHGHGRRVAVHCVTREALILALAAWETAGARSGDRVEHGAIADGPLARRISALGLTVVTQPGFIAERGDRYLTDVEPADRPHLWPCRTLIDAGVAVAASTDAPFGDPDPWRAVAAATTRRTAAGHLLGAEEAVDARTALALLLGTLTDPGGPPRRVRPGAPADLCLLDLPLDEALAHPSAERVALTLQAGTVVYRPR